MVAHVARRRAELLHHRGFVVRGGEGTLLLSGGERPALRHGDQVLLMEELSAIRAHALESRRARRICASVLARASGDGANEASRIETCPFSCAITRTPEHNDHLTQNFMFFKTTIRPGRCLFC